MALFQSSALHVPCCIAQHLALQSCGLYRALQGAGSPVRPHLPNLLEVVQIGFVASSSRPACYCGVGFSVRLRLLWAYRDSSSSSLFSRRLLVPRLVRRLLVARILLWLFGLLRRSFVCSRVDFANSRDLQLDEKAV